MKSRGCLTVKLIVGVLLVLLAGPARAQVSTTTVQGTVYSANGQPASGTLLLNWDAFTTANGQAVAAGSTSVTIGANGFVSVNLAPNLGATPAGSYYTAVYQLSTGSVSTEYWTVPSSGTATIASVRSTLEPAMVAVQTVSKSYVDSLVASIAPTTANYLPIGGGTMAGPLVLGSDPASNMQAADKHYVDQQVATALPVSGGTVSGSLTIGNMISVLPRVDVRSATLAGGADPTGTRDSLPAFQAAVSFALASALTGDTTYPAIYVPPGHYLLNGTLRFPQDMHMVGDGRANTILQETNPTANLLTVIPDSTRWCSTYSCLGGLDDLTLEGTGKATAGALLEIDTAQFVLRNLTFYNNGGRGLQMNGPSERISGWNLSFFDIRWPFVMAGDSNEDYFYNTHIIGAGLTNDQVSTTAPITNYCYSVNCTNGMYAGPGTSSNPTTIYPDPHGALHIEKSVNVTFIGGSIKDSTQLSSVRIWNADLVKFENIYHEDYDWSGVPSINRAYIFGGSAERTYLTGSLSGSGLVVAVNNASWMPQWYGSPADAQTPTGDDYLYVILPQDYDRTSTAASSYVSGLKKNQYEVVNIGGFASDGKLYITSRNAGGNAPAGIQWPAGSVIEQYVNGGWDGRVELNNIHINMVQGPTSTSSYRVGCNQQTANNCGEIAAGFAPETQNLTSNPATNQVEFMTPTGDPYDPSVYAAVHFSMRSMDMFNSGNNPYMGQIAVHHFAQMEIYGMSQLETRQGTEALSGPSEQIAISDVVGGSYITAPQYSNGAYAWVQVANPDGDSYWDNQRGAFSKRAAYFQPYAQYGTFMVGTQYQNLYCLFDTPSVDGAHITNRFCATGGPGNLSGSGAGYGPGIEYDSYNGTNWTPIFKATGQNGTGSVSIAAPLSVAGATTMTGTLNVSGAAAAATVSAGSVSASGAVSAGSLSSSGGAQVSGALTASVVNGAITVDGQTYTTLNAAWSAAAAAATSTGRNQTIWLAPGSYAVTQTLQEPSNGACVSVLGSAGTTVGANIASTATTLTVPGNLNGDVFFLGNSTLTEGCTFKDLNVMAGKNAAHGFELQWHRGLLMENVNVNDTTAEGILLGEEASNGHQSNVMMRNVTVSYSSASYAPSARPQYGIHLQKTLIDSYLHTILVRNALTAALYNEGSGNIGYGIHGFGYPYTCTTAPCSNTATSGSAANASYASNYVIYDVGGAGTVWTDTYADSPAISAFYVGANGVEIHGGHVQWPDLTSFPNANFASVSSSVTNNLLIADFDCLGMASTVNWITYASTGGVPPTFASVHHLTGCGNYYQALEPATTTGFSGGGASNNAPNTGQVATVWVAPKAASGSNYEAYSAQLYSGYTTDIFEGHFAAANPFFNITYQGTIRSQGGIALSTVLNTGSSLTLTTANKNVLANAASGAQTLTLPSCFTPMADKISPTGLELTVVKTDTSANAVTVQTVSSQTINYQGATATTLTLSSAGKRTLVCGPDYNWYAF